MRSRALLVAALVLVVASTAFPGVATPPTTADANEDALLAIKGLTHERPNPSTTDATTSGSSVTTAAEPEPNPWGTRTVTVGIRRAEGPVTDAHVAAVRRAAAFWNDRAANLTDHRIVFVVEPAAERVDVLVRFVPYIDECGAESGSITIGCAPQYDRGGSANVPTVVRIREGHPTNSLSGTITHEFGHLLGLAHGEGPMPVMTSRTAPSTPTALRNASERGYPWHEEVLTVSVAAGPGYDRPALRAHVVEALEYYERQVDRRLAITPSFRMVEYPERADIVLRFTASADACDVGVGYCWSIAGEDLDRDRAIEYYTRFEGTFGGLEQQYASWYAGRMIGYALGAGNETQLPDVFAKPENAGERWVDPEAGAEYGGEGTATDDPPGTKMP
ncbi:MAG: hypothetical protein ABEI31_05605 [Halodesulfurarchaeum sp.]